jgi:hypothetical protein
MQAGLFSAVITAFVVESYGALNRSDAHTTAMALVQISAQLSDSSVPAFVLPTSFTPAPSSVRVNIFWFLGLVVSLAAALFGFLMKQWLKAYLSWTEIFPLEEAVAVRQFRYDGVMKFKLHGICAGLPVLLQVALILFLAGLVDFLTSLQQVVGYTVSSVVAVCLFVTFVTVLLPGLIPTCPFRSPLSHLWRRFLVIFMSPIARLYGRRSGKHRLFAGMHQWLTSIDTWCLPWIAFDLSCIRDTDCATRSIHHLWSTSQDEGVLSRVTCCLYWTPDGYIEKLTMARCWPVVQAIGGFYEQGRLLGRNHCFRRAFALPHKVRHLLVNLLLDTLDGYTELALHTDGDAGGDCELAYQAVGFLPCLLPFLGEPSYVARYCAVLQWFVQHVSDGQCPYKLAEWDSRDHHIRGRLHEIELHCRVSKEMNYQRKGTSNNSALVCPCKTKVFASADALRLVNSVAYLAYAAHDSQWILVNLALPVAISHRFDDADSEGLTSLVSLLSIMARLVCQGLQELETRGKPCTAEICPLGVSLHSLHVLVARNRHVLPMALVDGLARNMGVGSEYVESCSEEKWELLSNRLQAACRNEEDSICWASSSRGRWKSGIE